MSLGAAIVVFVIAAESSIGQDSFVSYCLPRGQHGITCPHTPPSDKLPLQVNLNQALNDTHTERERELERENVD